MLVRELAARLGLDVDAQSFAKGQAAVEVVKFGLGKLVDVALQAVDAFRENIVEALEYGDATRKAAQAIGVESQALQELQYAAKLSDLSVEELNGGIAILTRTMRAAKAGGEEQAKAFRSAGVKITDATGKLRAADEVIGDIAAKFETLPDGAEKTALAMQLFGRSGARMIPLLNEGAEGLEDLRREARELGLVMGSDAQKASEEINDNLERLHMIAKGLWRGALTPLIPAISDLVKSFLDWRKANAAVLRQQLGKFLGGMVKIIKAVGSAFLFITSVMADLSTHGKTLTLIVSSLAVAFVAMNSAAIAAAASTAAAWAVAAAPIVGIGVAIAGLILVFNSLARWVEGKDSALGELFWKARQALVKFTEDPGVGDPWFVRMLREAARLAIFVQNKMDELFWRFKQLDEASKGTGADTWIGKTLSATPLGAAVRAARIGSKLNDLPGYKPPEERERYDPDLAFIQGTGANYNSSAGAYYHPPPAAAGRTTISAPISISVTQHPGENSEHLAQRVAAICDERLQSCFEESAASLPAVE